MGKFDRSFAKRRPYLQYLGLPYAEPPLDALRFARPRPFSAKWMPLVRNATGNPEPCLQPKFETVGGDSAGQVVGKEDCLVLNVYRPGQGCQFSLKN